uniref:Uncharacterized protein n=1 Tax=Oryza nivara TaxID=4536 RepID=A0A0E0GBL4_ORYNI
MGRIPPHRAERRVRQHESSAGDPAESRDFAWVRRGASASVTASHEFTATLLAWRRPRLLVIHLPDTDMIFGL